MPRLFQDSKLQSFSKRSSKIFDVFNQTKKDCESLNAEISAEKARKLEEVSLIQQEISDMDSIVAKNDTLVKKMDAFLNS
jgi:hypothetical protein